MKKFDNFVSHLAVLQKSPEQDLNNEFIVSGIIDKFSIQFELGWKVLKELLLYEGISSGKTGAPREIIREAYQCFDFMEEEPWLLMLKERNNTAHIYNGDAAKLLIQQIITDFIPEFENLKSGIEKKYKNVLDKLP
ncbi:MAG: nucleotidyltransferase [Dorea sp.]|nr:nucleotidyltransferase [Dorea sp.]